MLAILVPVVISDECPMIGLVMWASVVKYTSLSTNVNSLSRLKQDRTLMGCSDSKLSTEDDSVNHRDHGLYP